MVRPNLRGLTQATPGPRGAHRGCSPRARLAAAFDPFPQARQTRAARWWPGRAATKAAPEIITNCSWTPPQRASTTGCCGRFAGGSKGPEAAPPGADVLGVGPWIIGVYADSTDLTSETYETDNYDHIISCAAARLASLSYGRFELARWFHRRCLSSCLASYSAACSGIRKR